jgi:hypothetical protein
MICIRSFTRFFSSLILTWSFNIRYREIVYDYRLQQDADQNPIWYKPVQYEHDSFFGTTTTNNDDATATLVRNKHTTSPDPHDKI